MKLMMQQLLLVEGIEKFRGNGKGQREEHRMLSHKQLQTMEHTKVKPQVRFRPHADSRPIRYEDIVIGRDVVFLVKSLRHDPENMAAGAPIIETFSYTGMLESRDGDRFQLSYFSMTTSHPSEAGKNILADPGGARRQNMVLDESMTFWKMGELYVGQGEATKTPRA